MPDITLNKVSDLSLRGMSYEIRGILSGGRASDDNPIPLRLIDRAIKDTYSALVKQEDDIKEQKGEALDAQRVQPFPCLKLENNNDFYCACTKTGGSFKKVRLPKFIQSKGYPYISYLGNTDMDLEFMPAMGIQDLNARIPFSGKPGYFVAGSNAYVALPKDYALMCEVTVLGIPEDPLATSGPCFDIWSSEWNITGYMRARVKQEVLAYLGNVILTTGQNRDLRNNSQSGNQFVTIQTP